MTILATAPQLRLDSLILATNSHGLASIDGLDVIAQRRGRNLEVAGMPGAEAFWDDPPAVKVREFDVWALPYDADGNITYAGGALAHLRENIDQLQAILAKRGAPINVELDVPLPAGGVETRQGEAKLVAGVEVEGTRVRTWKIKLLFPHPYWRILPQITGVAPGAIATAGGARIHDIVATFTAAGNLTHSDTGRVVTATAACEVNFLTRKITAGGVAAPNLVTVSHDDWFWMHPATTNNITGTNVTLSYYNARP